MRLPITFLKASVRGHGSDGHLDVVQQDNQVLLQLTDSPPERQEADPASSQIFVDRLFGSSSCIFVAETVKNDGNAKLRNNHYWISVTFFPQENLVTFLLASLRIFGRLWGSMQIFPMIDSTGVTPWNCCCQWFFPCWALRRQVGVKWIWNRILQTFFLQNLWKICRTCTPVAFFCKIWVLIAIIFFGGSDPSTSELWMLMTYGVIEIVHDAKVPWMDLHIPYNDLLGQRRGSRAFGCVYFSWRTSFASANKNAFKVFMVFLFTSKIIHSFTPSILLNAKWRTYCKKPGSVMICFGFDIFWIQPPLKKNTRNRGKKWASETCKLSDFRSKKANCGLQVRSTRPCLPWFLAQPWMNLQNAWRSCTYSNVVYMDDDWCSHTYLVNSAFCLAIPKGLHFVSCLELRYMHPLRWLAHYIIYLVGDKNSLLAISTLETWVLWMTLAVASLNCCWMTLNDSTWGWAIKVETSLWFSQGVFSQSLLLLGQLW